MMSNEKNGLQSSVKDVGSQDNLEKPTLPDYSTAIADSSTAFQTNFASLSMHMTDRLRFLLFPPQTIDRCRQTIRTIWRSGIQSERDYYGSKEIKVRGNPWTGFAEEAVAARRLICALLGTLHSEGWVLTLSTDISKKNSDKDTLLFRHQTPAPAPCDWCCIGFSKNDRLKLIDVPISVVNVLIRRLGKAHIQSHSQHSTGVYELKLLGFPWKAEGSDTMRAREVLLILMQVLEGEGWTVYASVDQKNGAEEHTETDTWHCCKPQGWERGAPVYHN